MPSVSAHVIYSKKKQNKTQHLDDEDVVLSDFEV